MVSTNTKTKDILGALRSSMSEHGVRGYLIPRADEYQGEFVAPYAERLRWLTGFTGSAGMAVVLSDSAAVFTDGRYIVQLENEVDGAVYQALDISKTKPGAWIVQYALKDDLIGYDPMLHTPNQIADLQSMGVNLKAISQNLIDDIWRDQPVCPAAPVSIFPDDISGRSTIEKRRDITNTIKNAGLLGTLITSPASICWLLNIRGHDIEYIPLALSVLWLDNQGNAVWFIGSGQLDSAVRDYIGPDVKIVYPEDTSTVLSDILRQKEGRGSIGLDFSVAPMAYKILIEGQGMNVQEFRDPVSHPRSIKTSNEQAALKKAHVADGIALVKFLHWFEYNAVGVSEWGAAEKLESYRARSKAYKGPGFPTIAGFAGNAGIIHYRATEQNNDDLKAGNVFLVDSGGQYADQKTGVYGTTDITRTIAVGDVPERIQENFTRVLKAHIALARACFPEGTTGAQIDAITRMPLWLAGQDYAHGTGHGVGCYLAVHEPAANISPRVQDALEVGMLLSNEPGYYEPSGSMPHGIRIENLVLVRQNGACEATGKNMFCFETISYAPIDKNMIIRNMLNAEEISWLNGYHNDVFDILSPHLEGETREWLEDKTSPL